MEMYAGHMHYIYAYKIYPRLDTSPIAVTEGRKADWS